MAIYLKKTDDGNVEAYGDIATMEKHGGKYDRKVSDSNWAKSGCAAHLDAKGSIVLGLSDDDAEARNEATIRFARDMKLRQDCDSISALRLASMTTAEKSKWAAYRQALLDVPEQSGFPFGGDVDKVSWPKKPE